MSRPTPTKELAWRTGRNLLMWTVICTIAAAPSFIIAFFQGFDAAGLTTGVLLFILGYTAVASTDWAQRLKSQRAIRITLLIGYGTRLLLPMPFLSAWVIDLLSPSLAHRLEGMMWFIRGATYIESILPGMVSVNVVDRILEPLGVPLHGFAGTLFTTIVQGVMLNVILGFYLLIIFLIVRLIIRNRLPGELQCPACGYDLRGSRGSRACPECGEPTRRDEARTLAEENRRLRAELDRLRGQE